LIWLIVRSVFPLCLVFQIVSSQSVVV